MIETWVCGLSLLAGVACSRVNIVAEALAYLRICSGCRLGVEGWGCRGLSSLPHSLPGSRALFF